MICTPFVYISNLSKIKPSKVALGAQDSHYEETGAFTGEVSAKMLAGMKVKYCIVGHSERRAMGEDNEMCNKKIIALLKNGITPILCVGEKERDHSGFYLNTVKEQVTAALSLIPKANYKSVIIAYEPVWAIGAQEPATAAECFEAVIAIRRALASLGGIDYAKKVHILYGGAITKDTVKTFLEEGGVDGLLIGRASQEVGSLVDILNAAYAH